MEQSNDTWMDYKDYILTQAWMRARERELIPMLNFFDPLTGQEIRLLEVSGYYKIKPNSNYMEHQPAIADLSNKIEDTGVNIKIENPGVDSKPFKLVISADRCLRGTDFMPMEFMPTEDHTEPIPWKELSEEDKKEVLAWSHKHANGINKDIEDMVRLIPKYPTNEISDGFHTFGELYEMRLILTKALFKQLYDKFMKTHQVNPIWKSKLHEDGTMFEGYFVVGAFPPSQHFGVHEAITFHYPMDGWNLFWFAQTLEKAPPFDGHTSADVLERLKNL